MKPFLLLDFLKTKISAKLREGEGKEMLKTNKKPPTIVSDTITIVINYTYQGNNQNSHIVRKHLSQPIHNTCAQAL